MIADTLPRSYEVLVRDRIKFRVGQIVYIAFSPDEGRMGFAFPKEERAALVTAEPRKFCLPKRSDMRFNWAVAELDRIGPAELEEIVLSAWELVVPKRVSTERLGSYGR